jgi:hypothetical protein
VPGHSRGIHGQAELGHHLGGRPLDRFAADDRRHRDDRRRAFSQRLANPRESEDRVDADERI